MRQFLCLLVLFFFSCPAEASPARIEACVKDAANKNVRLFLVEDQVTKKRIKVDETTIDANGCFSLQADVPGAVQAFIVIDYYQTYIYLEPDETYQLVFDKFDFYLHEKMNPHKYNRYLSYQFNGQDTNELNQLIWRFENQIDNFMSAHYMEFLVSPNKELLSDFIDHLKAMFDYSGHAFFKAYKTYAIADLERIFSLKTGDKLFFQYIQNKPILYDNPAYTDFMMAFYGYYFPNEVRYNRFLFIDQINLRESYPVVMDSIGRDTTLQNEKLREFVFLIGLKNMYHMPEFKASSVLFFLDYMAEHSKFYEHQKMAKAIKYELLKFSKGIQAPSLSRLLDVNQVHFRERGNAKYRYLLFENSLCESCAAELKTLNTLVEKYPDVEFVVINCDYELQRFEREEKQKKGAYRYVNFNKDFDMLEQFGIIDYPTAVLLDQNNKVLSFFEKTPSQGLEAFLKNLINQDAE